MGNQIIKIGDYCDIIKGNIGIQKAIPGEYPLVVTAKDRLSHNEYQFDATAVIIPLVSSTGHGHASIKRLHYQEGKFALGTILCAVIVKDPTIINPRFLYIYLSYFKDHLLVPLMKGAANVTLSIKKIKDVEIILPSLERQLEIIELEQNNEILEELNFEIENQKELITQLKQSILQEAIQGKLTEEWRKQNPDVEPASELLKRIKAEKAQLIKDKKIRKEKPLPPITEDEIPFELPEDWVWCRLDDLTTINGGFAFKSSQYINEGVRVIRISDFNEDGFSNDKVVRYKYTYELEPYILKEENILMAMTGGTVGKSLLVKDLPEKMVVNQRVATINILSQISPAYINCVIPTNLVQDVIKEAKNSTNDNISMGNIKGFLIPLPPLEEQTEIVAKVDLIKTKINDLGSEIAQSEQHAQMLMQAVLKEAFESKKEELC